MKMKESLSFHLRQQIGQLFQDGLKYRQLYRWIRKEAEPHTLSVNGHSIEIQLLRTGAYVGD